MTTFVLLPGAGGSRWYWHRVASELVDRGHEVLAIGLPAADPDAGLTAYAEITRAAVDERGDPGELVLVGQSLGGFTASLVASQLPTDRLVLLNAMIPRPGETAGEWFDNTGADAARRANDVAQDRDPDADFDEAVYFFHDVPSEVMADAADDSQPEAAAAFAEPWPLPSWPTVPTRVLVGAEDRLFPAEFQRRVARERLDCEVELIPGGHLTALVHPGVIADLLERP
jgi:pimeloyl-ACP methyl ester carboxylesterase